jgi:RNA-binding protein Musashi
VDVKRARTRSPRNHDNHPPAEDNNVSYESKKVFVGGLRDNVTEEEFKAYFVAFGTVTDAVVIYDSLTNKSRGFGFVTFDSEEAVNKVMRQSFHNLNGTKVEVKIAIPKDEQYYRNGRGRGGRPFGVTGPVNYEGPVYPPYARYGLYNGYMPQPVPAQPFYPAPYFAMPYGNGYPSQGVMPNVPGMMASGVPQVYGPYPQMHPGFNFVSSGGFGDPVTSFQNGFNGGSENKKDQTTVDSQDVVSTATKLEHMKLGSQ